MWSASWRPLARGGCGRKAGKLTGAGGFNKGVTFPGPMERGAPESGSYYIKCIGFGALSDGIGPDTSTALLWRPPGRNGGHWAFTVRRTAGDGERAIYRED